MSKHRNVHGYRVIPDQSFGSVVDSFSGSGGIHKRRGNPRPTPGESLTVMNPEIKEVLCTETGSHRRVQDVIGSDYAELVKLRMRIRTLMQLDTPAYRCSICHTAVHLCCSPTAKQFFFKHRHEDGNCPANTRGSLSQNEINARKYNGAKESNQHVQMKAWLASCLTLDGRFTNIDQERRWTGAFSGEWRRPDVSATYNGIPIAFEIQLSTTYLNVMAERRQFYLNQGGLLFWVFAAFDGESPRMLEDDVFYNNNQNVFVVNANTVQDSRDANEFRLECIWAEPTVAGGSGALHRKTVPFHELTLEQASQRAYYFDFDGKRQALVKQRSDERENLRREFEEWFDVQGFYSDNRTADWDHFRSQFARVGVETPRYVSQLDQGLFVALYSVKHGRPFGVRYKKLVEVAHRVAIDDKHHLIWFMQAARQYERLKTLEEQGSGKWPQRYAACQTEYRENAKPFEPKRDQQMLVEFLFPELLPLR